MNGFHAGELAIEIGRRLKPIVLAVKQHDAELADQIYRAAKSMALNAPEGGRRSGRDRNYHFKVAAGSAAEIVAAIRFAIAWDYLPPQPDVLAELDRELAMLWRLEHPKR